MTPAFLDDGALARFEAALRSAGAAIAGAWQDGLTDDRIEAITGPAGVSLPEEARRWWRWRDGVATATPPAAACLVPRRPLLDLAMVVAEFTAGREHARQVDGRDFLLRPVADQPWIFFNCGGAVDEPVPVLVGGHGEATRPALPSIGLLVKVWTELIETGVFTTDAEGGWEWDFEKVPESVRKLGVY